MSDAAERGPCPRCGEAAPLAARVCPHCKGNLLVDVSLDHAPAEGRTRYQIARGLSGLGPPAPSFAAAQQAVAIPGSVLAAGVTREFAQKVLELLDEHGARGRTTAATLNTGGAASPPEQSRFSSLLVIVLLLALAGSGLYVWTQRTGGGGESDEIALPTRAARTAALGPALSSRELAARMTPATVVLRCPNSLGSGFFVAKDLVLTNAHVLCGAGEPLKASLSDGRELVATPGQRDDWLDLALVQVPGANAAPLPLGDATVLRTGDHVAFIGTPEGLAATVHEGIVSHQARNIFGVAYLQIDGNVNPGNSGGPLLDTQGRVVGIVSARLEKSEGLGFALPINYAYYGGGRLVPPPVRPQPDEQSWTRLLADVETADRKDVQRADLESSRPALLQLLNSRDRGLMAVVARRSLTEPRSETLTFVFRGNDRVLCQVSALAGDWRKVSAGDAGTDGARSRYMQWAQKHGLQKDIFLGFAPLDVQSCPLEDMRGAELTLEGGDERANRVSL